MHITLCYGENNTSRQITPICRARYSRDQYQKTLELAGLGRSIDKESLKIYSNSSLVIPGKKFFSG